MNSRIQKLITYLARLPGIGPRQAARLALALAEWNKEDLCEFGNAMHNMQNGALFCRQCFNMSDNDLCRICSDTKRNKSRVAIVERISDIEPLEKAGFDGTYHVLGGVISPSGHNNLRIKELINRIAALQKIGNGTKQNIEVIIATNPNTYGETTAMYLKEKLVPSGIKITRLAQGLSTGSSIEYSDEITLFNALKHRK